MSSKYLVEFLASMSFVQAAYSIPTAPETVNETVFANTEHLRNVISKVGGSGLRAPGNKAHNWLVDWIDGELHEIPGLDIEQTESEFIKWHPKDDQTLEMSGSLSIGNGDSQEDIAIAGATPLSQPTNGTTLTGQLIYVPSTDNITETDVAGKIVLRDFPRAPFAYSLVFFPGYFQTDDLAELRNSTYDRPSQADGPLALDIRHAAAGGALGFVSLFNVPREQVLNYYEPHQGTRFSIPGVHVGVDEASQLKRAAASNQPASISVAADVGTTTARDIIATLHGRSRETNVLVTHTDGSTWVQDNGAAALLSLAAYFSRIPIELRHKTLRFIFTSGHMQVAQETTYRIAQDYDRTYEDGDVALVIPLEHMGTREAVAVPRGNNATGDELQFTGKNELLLWSVGPIEPLVEIVKKAVTDRKLDRVLVTRGTAVPDASKVPEINSFGGLGTFFHTSLVPTTAVISGPWTLWTRAFGESAMDFERFRSQTLAVGDVVLAASRLTKDELAGGYIDSRKERANRKEWNKFVLPPLWG